MINVEFVIKIYDEHGRLKLPSGVLKALKLGKNTLLRVIVENDRIVMIPVRKTWPKKGSVDEDTALSEKHLAWYEV